MKLTLEAYEAAIACAPSLATCVETALLNHEFVANWNRLRPEHHISVMLDRSPIQAMVDKACKVPPVVWSKEARDEFFTFVRDHLWRPTFLDVLKAAAERLEESPTQPIPGATP